jgi:putative endonuclease
MLRLMAENRRQSQGAAGEALAARHLEAHRLVVIRRNFRCRAGELDLICRESDVLVIVEVRQRSGSAFGGALASVTLAKQHRILRATQYFLLCERRWRHHRLRFDVVAVHGAAPGAQAIEWIRDAFRPP